MGVWDTIRGWFKPHPAKVRLLVVAPGREVAAALRRVGPPTVHEWERDGSDSYAGVLVFEGGRRQPMVAILHGDARETHVELVGLGSEGEKGAVPDEGRRLLEKQFPVVPLEPAKG